MLLPQLPTTFMPLVPLGSSTGSHLGLLPCAFASRALQEQAMKTGRRHVRCPARAVDSPDLRLPLPPQAQAKKTQEAQGRVRALENRLLEAQVGLLAGRSVVNLDTWVAVPSELGQGSSIDAQALQGAQATMGYAVPKRVGHERHSHRRRTRPPAWPPSSSAPNAAAPPTKKSCTRCSRWDGSAL